jgi:hypothetical protein
LIYDLPLGTLINQNYDTWEIPAKSQSLEFILFLA